MRGLYRRVRTRSDARADAARCRRLARRRRCSRRPSAGASACRATDVAAFEARGARRRPARLSVFDAADAAAPPLRGRRGARDPLHRAAASATRRRSASTRCRSRPRARRSSARGAPASRRPPPAFALTQETGDQTGVVIYQARLRRRATRRGAAQRQHPRRGVRDAAHGRPACGGETASCPHTCGCACSTPTPTRRAALLAGAHGLRCASGRRRSANSARPHRLRRPAVGRCASAAPAERVPDGSALERLAVLARRAGRDRDAGRAAADR